MKPIQRLEDNGDLRDFLRVFAPTLDWLKAKIDDFPVLWDLDRVPADFLPFLGALVGYPYEVRNIPDFAKGANTMLELLAVVKL